MLGVPAFAQNSHICFHIRIIFSLPPSPGLSLLPHNAAIPGLEICERRLNMESDERSIRIQWEGWQDQRDGEIRQNKKYRSSVVAGAERRTGRGRNSSARGAREWRPVGSFAAGGLTRTRQHTQPKNQHRRRQITTHIIRSCRLPSHHESFVRGLSVMYDAAS